MTVAARLIPAIMLAVLLQGFAGPAFGATAPSPTTIDTTLEDDILWFTAQVTADDIVRTKIFAPARKDGRRSLWQVCKFGSTGTGEYRCGIDVASGSMASKRVGTWLAKVFIGAEQVASTRFATVESPLVSTTS